MDIKFFKCNICGQIVAVVEESGVPLVCCGEDMVQMVPKTADTGAEKHVPVVVINDDKVAVTVGEIEHPMEGAHYIEWILVQTKYGTMSRQLSPGQEPAVSFKLCKGDEVLAVYCYCNLHSLWKTAVKAAV